MSTLRKYRRSPTTEGCLVNARGQTKTGMLLFVLFMAAAVFVGSQVIPFYYYYYELEGFMQSQADIAATTTDDKIRKVLLKKIKELEIPIGSEDELRINRFNNKIVIDMKYSEVLYIDLGKDWSRNLWVFEFNPHAERVF